MFSLNANQRLAALTVAITVFCLIYFLCIESARTTRAKREFAQLIPASVSAINLPDGRVITDAARINAIVSALQRSHWSAFGRSYATDRRRLLLRRDHAPAYIIDLRPLAAGRELVQVVRFNSSNQTEMLLLSGENTKIEPLLEEVH